MGGRGGGHNQPNLRVDWEEVHSMQRVKVLCVIMHRPGRFLSISQASWYFLSIINLSPSCSSQQEITAGCVSLQSVSGPDLSKPMQPVATVWECKRGHLICDAAGGSAIINLMKPIITLGDVVLGEISAQPETCCAARALSKRFVIRRMEAPVMSRTTPGKTKCWFLPGNKPLAEEAECAALDLQILDAPWGQIICKRT